MTQNSGQRVAVITGASSGIGKVAAIALARAGWQVIAQGRDPERTAAAAADIRAAAAAGTPVDMVRGDLSSLVDTARVATEIAGLTGRVHLLLNNAGGICKNLVITAEGNEANFAGNHLGHFLLTRTLLPSLRAAASAGEAGTVRVVNVSSRGHEVAPPIDWSDLQRVRNWNSMQSYCLSKLFNILFTRELARRVAANGIVVNAMHPGVVASNFASHADAAVQRNLASKPNLSSEDGADTLVWLATAAEAGRITGEYFFQRAVTATSLAAKDDTAAARLWTESEALLSRAGIP
jgi:NAD(P)-dependent dehydrogenase (short-subunit alcohol dehydrogenase family)